VICPKDKITNISKAMTAAGGQLMDLVVGGAGVTVKAE